jgi:hypothetical protein
MTEGSCSSYGAIMGIRKKLVNLDWGGTVVFQQGVILKWAVVIYRIPTALNGISSTLLQ